jgi:hypothetical protein
VIGFATTQSLPQLEEMVPLNAIILWSGTLLDIPDGYQFCDGTNGTPDLRDKFILSAGFAHEPGETGGSSDHTHNYTGIGHAHDAIATHQCPGGGSITAATVQSEDLLTTSDPGEGTTEVGNNTPEFYSLAYIQRMV